MSALDTMKSALQCSKTEAAKLRIRVRQLEEKLVEVAAIGEQEADKLRQGSEFLVAENARLVAAVTALKASTWLIWSFEHDAWWAPDGRGYTREVELAGRYSRARAEEIVRNANLGCPWRNEAMLPAPDESAHTDAPRGAK